MFERSSCSFYSPFESRGNERFMWPCFAVVRPNGSLMARMIGVIFPRPRLSIELSYRRCRAYFLSEHVKNSRIYSSNMFK